mgnify:CR=1 FL=1
MNKPLRTSLLAVCVIALTAGTACGGSVDFSDPASVTSAVFQAAKSGDTSKLAGLCDPKKENDGDTRRICELTPESKKFEQFKEYFASGKVEGSPEIKGDKAQVKFKFGPKGEKDETMKLVQRDGKWYLASF